MQALWRRPPGGAAICKAATQLGWAFPKGRDKTVTHLFPPRVENRPGFVAVELKLRNYYYDVVN